MASTSESTRTSTRTTYETSSRPANPPMHLVIQRSSTTAASPHSVSRTMTVEKSSGMSNMTPDNYRLVTTTGVEQVLLPTIALSILEIEIVVRNGNRASEFSPNIRTITCAMQYVADSCPFLACPKS